MPTNNPNRQTIKIVYLKWNKRAAQRYTKSAKSLLQKIIIESTRSIVIYIFLSLARTFKAITELREEKPETHPHEKMFRSVLKMENIFHFHCQKKIEYRKITSKKSKNDSDVSRINFNDESVKRYDLFGYFVAEDCKPTIFNK